MTWHRGGLGMCVCVGSVILLNLLVLNTVALPTTRNVFYSYHTSPPQHSQTGVDDEVPLTDLLEYMDLETLDAQDPRINTPGGLTLTSHSGADLVFTRENNDGIIAVNGVPVNGFTTLADGTEVYTLERFLSENKHRLDEAFQYLSTQGINGFAKSGSELVQSHSESQTSPLPGLQDTSNRYSTVPPSQGVRKSSKNQRPSLQSQSSSTSDSHTTARSHSSFRAPISSPNSTPVASSRNQRPAPIAASPRPSVRAPISSPNSTPVTSSREQRPAPIAASSRSSIRAPISSPNSTPVTSSRNQRPAPIAASSRSSIRAPISSPNSTPVSFRDQRPSPIAGYVREPRPIQPSPIVEYDTGTDYYEYYDYETANDTLTETISSAPKAAESVAEDEIPVAVVNEEPVAIAVSPEVVKPLVGKKDSLLNITVLKEPEQDISGASNRKGKSLFAPRDSSNIVKFDSGKPQETETKLESPLEKDNETKAIKETETKGIFRTGKAVTITNETSINPVTNTTDMSTDTTDMFTDTTDMFTDTTDMFTDTTDTFTDTSDTLTDTTDTFTDTTDTFTDTTDAFTDTTDMFTDTTDDGLTETADPFTDYTETADPFTDTTDYGFTDTADPFTDTTMTDETDYLFTDTTDDTVTETADPFTDTTDYGLTDPADSFTDTTDYDLTETESTDTTPDPFTETTADIYTDDLTETTDYGLTETTDSITTDTTDDGITDTADLVSDTPVTVNPTSDDPVSDTTDMSDFPTTDSEVSDTSDTITPIFDIITEVINESSPTVTSTPAISTTNPILRLFKIPKVNPGITLRALKERDRLDPDAGYNPNRRFNRNRNNRNRNNRFRNRNRNNRLRLNRRRPRPRGAPYYLSLVKTAPLDVEEIAEPKVEILSDVAIVEQKEPTLELEPIPEAVDSLLDKELTPLKDELMSEIKRPDFKTQALIFEEPAQMEAIEPNIETAEFQSEVPTVRESLVFTENNPLPESQIFEASLVESEVPDIEANMPLVQSEAESDVMVPLSEPVIKEIVPEIISSLDTQVPVVEEVVNGPVKPIAEEVIPVHDSLTPVAEAVIPSYEAESTNVEAAPVREGRVLVPAVAKSVLSNDEMVVGEYEIPDSVKVMPIAKSTIPILTESEAVSFKEPAVVEIQTEQKVEAVTSTSTVQPQESTSKSYSERDHSEFTATLPTPEDGEIVAQESTLQETIIPDFMRLDPSVATSGIEDSIPLIPSSLPDTGVSLLNLWRYALVSQSPTRAPYTMPRAVKTVLSPDHFVMMNLVPQNAPHPLYHDAPQNVALRTHFLLDHLVSETVVSDDPRMSQPEGLKVVNMAGHILTFRKDKQSGVITVNGLPVVYMETLNDGTEVYTVADLLFDHRAKIDQAFLRMVRRARQIIRSGPRVISIDSVRPMRVGMVPQQSIRPIKGPLIGSREKITPIARINEAVDKTEVLVSEIPSLIPVKVEKEIPVITPVPVEAEIPVITPVPVAVEAEMPVISSVPVAVEAEIPVISPVPIAVEAEIPVLSPVPIAAEAQVPVRSPVPIAVETPSKSQVPVPVKEEVPVRSPVPVAVAALVRSPVPVEKEIPVQSTVPVEVPVRSPVPDPIIPVMSPVPVAAEVPVSSPVPIAGEVKVPVEEGPVPDEEVPFSVAVDMIEQFGENNEMDKQDTQDYPPIPVTIPALPKIPTLVSAMDSSSLLGIWQNALDIQEPTTEDELAVPKTILSPHYFAVMNLVPQDAPHPLFSSAPAFSALRAEFLLDYLVVDSVSPSDPRMKSPEGVTVTNMAGHKLVFKISEDGHMRVNGVRVEGTHTLVDGTQVYTLSWFLFSHFEQINVAFKKMLDQQAILETTGAPLAFQIPLMTPTTAATDKDVWVLPTVPQIPKSVLEREASTLINLWHHGLRKQGPPALLRQQTEPRTVLSPSYEAVRSLVPQDAPHPLYHRSPATVALRTEMLLDYLVSDSILPDDPRLSEPEGLTIANMAGHKLTFKANPNGGMSVNGVAVTRISRLRDGTISYTLSDFLFTHRDRVENAVARIIDQTEPLTSTFIPSVEV